MRNVYRNADAEFRVLNAHDGDGEVLSARVADDKAHHGLNFIDMTEVPAGHSIGIHTHDMDNEEIYVVLSGIGLMTIEDRTVEVKTGDVVVNPPGGTHGLRNPGPDVLKIVVLEIPLLP